MVSNGIQTRPANFCRVDYVNPNVGFASCAFFVLTHFASVGGYDSSCDVSTKQRFKQVFGHGAQDSHMNLSPLYDNRPCHSQNCCCIMYTKPRHILALVRLLKASTDPPSADGLFKLAPSVASCGAWWDTWVGSVKKATVLVE
ncbi:hypothetical protein BKA82DRAFT_27242 [Pisolithus tinctorius]|uniref:Uncharacterized protein n=1 Tax=Pisolithus tinctorius Marx 270 TaxID=870435 RepID=A0A0C3P779_PISTI|nr:hypothetical protein BKA82DRAFT_27242 [Pisolithus tinctorius]KIO03269.1 hypothetical protein M404DRAFT_27242 [Pisolithus tinctorius Marx 270]